MKGITMPLICNVPKDDTYDLPEGRYRAVLSSVRPQWRPHANKPVQQIRLLFAVQIPSLLNKNPMAGRTFNFDLKRGSELRVFVESWLGADIFSHNTTVDFEQLVGCSADLNLIHRHNDGYDRPYVFVEAIHPAGTLKLTEQPTASPAPTPAPIPMAVEEADQQWRNAA
jgi:hypothetical protein